MTALPRHWTCGNCDQRIHAPEHLLEGPAQRYLDAMVPKHRCRPPRKARCPRCNRYSVDLQHFSGGIIVKLVHAHTPTGAEGCIFNLEDPVVAKVAKYLTWRDAQEIADVDA